MLTTAEQKKLDTLKTKHVDEYGKFRKKTPKAIKDMIKHLIAMRDEPQPYHPNCPCDPVPPEIEDQKETDVKVDTETPQAPAKTTPPAKNDPTLALRPKECPEHLTHLLDQGFTYVGVSSRGWHYVKNANDLFRVDEEKGKHVPKRLSRLADWTPKLLKNLLK